MFTGIIQELGQVKSALVRAGNLRLEIDAPLTAGKLKIGDSVAVDGACQTVVQGDGKRFAVEAVAETLSRTTLGRLKNGSQVNLELPVGLGDLLHGHLVQGHIDCTGKIVDIRPLAGSQVVTVSYPGQYDKYLIEKGSVAVDGVSLTVVEPSAGRFKVSIIPHTFANTGFSDKKPGDSVNLEFDMLAKYVEKIISPRQGGLTADFLKEHGF